MVDYVPLEKAIPVRQPSTANLMIDSADRVVANYPYAGNFIISKNASILNGFFTRIGTTEVVLDWAEPNIITDINDTIDIQVSATTETITLDQGFYTVEQALDTIVAEANDAFPTLTFSVVQNGGSWFIECEVTAGGAAQNFLIVAGLLQAQLGFTPAVSASSQQVGVTKYPDLRTYKYLDIVSNELTYAQDLKDSSTAEVVRDVLCRWYFAWDTQPLTDGYGFSIFQGYTAFQQRRLFSPPKQIRWEPNLPIGNLGFQVFAQLVGGVGSSELLLSDNFNFLMTLQVSEQ